MGDIVNLVIGNDSPANITEFCAKPTVDGFSKFSDALKKELADRAKYCIDNDICDQALARKIHNFYITRNMTNESKRGVRSLNLGLVFISEMKSVRDGDIFYPFIRVYLKSRQNSIAFEIVYSKELPGMYNILQTVEELGVDKDLSLYLDDAKDYLIDIFANHPELVIYKIDITTGPKKLPDDFFDVDIGILWNFEKCAKCIRMLRDGSGTAAMRKECLDLVYDKECYKKFKNRPVFEECGICYQELFAGNMALQCGHTFHTTCIDKWLETKNSCPLCRKPVREEVKEGGVIVINRGELKEDLRSDIDVMMDAIEGLENIIRLNINLPEDTIQILKARIERSRRQLNHLLQRQYGENNEDDLDRYGREIGFASYPRLRDERKVWEEEVRRGVGALDISLVERGIVSRQEYNAEVMRRAEESRRARFAADDRNREEMKRFSRGVRGSRANPRMGNPVLRLLEEKKARDVDAVVTDQEAFELGAFNALQLKALLKRLVPDIKISYFSTIRDLNFMIAWVTGWRSVIPFPQGWQPPPRWTHGGSWIPPEGWVQPQT